MPVGSGSDAGADVVQEAGDAWNETSAGGALGHAGAAGAGAGGEAGAAGAGAGGAAGQGGALPACPTFADAITAGTVQSQEINEASGMVGSRRQPGVFWVHNDSGDSARVFAMGVDGAHLGEFGIDGSWATDWEDMALGPGPAATIDYLYLGDFGDNAESRDYVIVFRGREPTVDSSSGPVTGSLEDVDELRLTYPGGEAHNAETLLVDPSSGDLFIVSKASSGESGVYRSAAPHDTVGTRELVLVATLTFGSAPLDGSPLATAGDVSADGSLVAVRTYNRAYVWRRTHGTPLWTAFDTEPCPVPLHGEPQGETIAFSSSGDAYYTVSEGTSQPIYEFDRLP